MSKLCANSALLDRQIQRRQRLAREAKGMVPAEVKEALRKSDGAKAFHDVIAGNSTRGARSSGGAWKHKPRPLHTIKF